MWWYFFVTYLMEMYRLLCGFLRLAGSHGGVEYAGCEVLRLKLGDGGGGVEGTAERRGGVYGYGYVFHDLSAFVDLLTLKYLLLRSMSREKNLHL